MNGAHGTELRLSSFSCSAQRERRVKAVRGRVSFFDDTCLPMEPPRSYLRTRAHIPRGQG